jgi:hypothetical protein
MSNVKIKQLYSLYDSKSETWSAPFIHSARGDALRAFADAVNSKDQRTVIVAHPEDFTLFYVGDFNELDGTITGIDKVSVANGMDVKIDDTLQPTPMEKHIANAT